MRHESIRTGSVRTGLLALTALLLTACAATGVTVYQTDLAQQYNPATLGLIGSGKHDLGVAVTGNPFAADNATATDEAALVDAVIAGIQGHTGGIPVTFSATPANPYPRGDYRTVFVFNAARGVSQWDLCRAGDLAAVPTAVIPAAAPGATAEIRVFAAYCQGEMPLSWAGARAREVAGPRSETVSQLMSQIAIAMFPSRNRHRDENCVPRIFPCR